jgi:hypothetical protein
MRSSWNCRGISRGQVRHQCPKARRVASPSPSRSCSSNRLTASISAHILLKPYRMGSQRCPVARNPLTGVHAEHAGRTFPKQSLLKALKAAHHAMGSSELCQVRKEATVLSRTCAVARCNWSRRQSTTPGVCATSAQRTALSFSYLGWRAVTTQRAAMPSPLPIQPIASLPVTLTSTSVNRSPRRRASLLCMGTW